MTRPGARPAPTPPGARIGRVTALDPAGPLVEVASLVTEHSYGPARVAAGAAPVTLGDEVLVVFLGDSRTELVIVDRLLPLP